jgi:peptide/nickel transport system substrate-binding protein
MTYRITRREFAIAAATASLAGGFGVSAKSDDTKTLRFIMRSDLRVLDPIWTTAYISRDHGCLVFDTLFALDSKFTPHPQMVDGYSISPDQLIYRFTLRDGLKFHDGQHVRGTDCIASLRRWMARDALGQTLANVIDDLTVTDEKNFTVRLKEPFPLLINALAKVSSLVPFIMPERLAKTDPYQQITEVVGHIYCSRSPGGAEGRPSRSTQLSGSTISGVSGSSGGKAPRWSRSSITTEESGQWCASVLVRARSFARSS